MQMDDNLRKFQSEKSNSLSNCPCSNIDDFEENMAVKVLDQDEDTKNRPGIAEILKDDNTPIKQDSVDFFGQPMEHNLSHVKQCIKRISILDKTLVDRAMKETARNRKMNNLNNFENMTTG